VVVWTPPSQEPSPAAKRKFKPVTFKPTEATSSPGGPLLILQQQPQPQQQLDQHQHQQSLLPRYQSPTVTLLKKAREGSLPKGAAYLPQVASSSVSSATPPPQRRVLSQPALSPTLLKTKSVLPEEEQHSWYKLMYEQIHVEKGMSKLLERRNSRKSASPANLREKFAKL
jgi:hypothetical protein